ncbi:hypothetical protein AMTRI_Chr02g214880 [Amborella trichopoda]|uniref:SHSP domain-containing protein n=1 Tax=Amborella trichopoda TaxID=13333 RepID=U5DGT4_AMBTC|nr:15.4 kDa class V heat shock protein [Amborella trichopoda]ERN19638.1 hypothetical protein AMTR_s00062p00149670 [Amborella trichopoda]|eukprot:XP_006858171.1 15.4 kDa class V heat shock protein [Amborella trichopoda]
MEFSAMNPSLQYFMASTFPLASYRVRMMTPENHVEWRETPHAHVFSADLPGVRKEDIRVEVEDSLYLIIRTENQATDEMREEEGGERPLMRRRRFMRKFRLPEGVNITQISAEFRDGVLSVNVPRLVSLRERFRVDPSDVPDCHELLAPAA